MPYIKPEEREELEPLVSKLLDTLLNGERLTPGTLNYLYTKMAHFYVARKGRSYTVLNDVVGVFESAKAEFQRRVVNPYEDEKIEENGDV